MRTTIVPAQITTVEDRISGNLTFSQVLLLISALLIASVFYLALPPHRGFGNTKVAVMVVECIFFAVLTLRIQGRIMADWLVLYLRFAVRPRIYVFTKNDLTSRETAGEEYKKVIQPMKVTPSHVTSNSLSLPEQLKLTKLLANPSLTVRFALTKKGGIDVSLTPID
jgi:hypothetical protein